MCDKWASYGCFRVYPQNSCNFQEVSRNVSAFSLQKPQKFPVITQ